MRKLSRCGKVIYEQFNVKLSCKGRVILMQIVYLDRQMKKIPVRIDGK